MTEFVIDPDIRAAATIDSRFYLDERIFELSRERIFARSWQMVGRVDQLQTLNPLSLLPGFLDEPLLVVRRGDQLRCLSNVCTHRGKVLVEAACDADLIRCGYHGRRFDLGGRFLSMPEFDAVRDFPSPSDDLSAVPLAQYAGFVFVSLDPVLPLSEVIRPAAERVSDFPFESMTFYQRSEYDVQAHWALYCENYLEGFHIPFVHRSLNAVVDYGKYKTETFRYASLQTAFDERGEIAGRYMFIFPNLMLNFYPWGLSVNIVRPVTSSLTKVEFISYVTDEALRETGAGADLHRVELEDEEVVESVQRGLRSRFYDRGRYSPTREQGTHHFHRLLAEFIG